MYLTGMHTLSGTHEHRSGLETQFNEGDHRWQGHVTFGGWRTVSRSGQVSAVQLAVLEQDGGLDSKLDPDDEVDYAYQLVDWGLANRIEELHMGSLLTYQHFSGDGAYETRTRIDVRRGGIDPRRAPFLSAPARPVAEWNGRYRLFAGAAGAGIDVGQLGISAGDACATLHASGLKGPAFELECPIVLASREIIGSRITFELIGHGPHAAVGGRYSGYLHFSADAGYSIAGTRTTHDGQTAGFLLDKGWN